MSRDITQGNRGMWISLCCGFLILGLAACNSPGADSNDPEVEATETQVGGQGGELDRSGKCPAEKTLYELSYSHLQELTIPPGGDEIVMKFENDPPTYFLFWINPSGQVSDDGGMTRNLINVEGSAKTPSDECPVQQISGVWELTARITGTCKDGVVKIHVIEEYVNPELEGSCGKPIIFPGTYSAPEVDLTFNIGDPMATDGLTYGESGSGYYLSLGYQLFPSTMELIPTLSPPSD